MKRFDNFLSQRAESALLANTVKRLCWEAILLLGICVGMGSAANCATLLDNTTSPVKQSTFLYSDGGFRIGVSFTTGSLAYHIDTVKFVPVGFFATTADYTVYLYQANSSYLPTGNPVTSQTLTGLNAVSYTSATSNNAVTMNADSTWIIQPNTNYSLVFSSTGAGEIGAVDPMTTAPSTGSSGITYRGQVYKSPNWATAGLNNQPWIQVTGTLVPVPEPSTCALALISTCALICTQHRRKSLNGSTKP